MVIYQPSWYYIIFVDDSVTFYLKYDCAAGIR